MGECLPLETPCISPLDAACPICCGKGEVLVRDPQTDQEYAASCAVCRKSGCIPREKAFRLFAGGTVSIPPFQSPPGENPKQAHGDRKLPVHLVPPALVLETAPNMGDGARKYGAYNWRAKKVKMTTYLGAMVRHLAQLMDGEDVDPESPTGATHLGAIGANVAILADAIRGGFLDDDRPAKGPASAMIRRAQKA